jgi:hypothetical protein
VVDRTGAIYSLRAHPYVVSGSDEEKFAFLRSRAHLDYLVAAPFPVPDGYHGTMLASTADGSISERRLPVAYHGALDLLGGPIALFRDVFVQVERRLPSQTALTVGPCPRYCLTPLYADDDLRLHPVGTSDPCEDPGGT